MNEIRKNYKLIIICICVLIFIPAIYFIVNSDGLVKKKYYLKDNIKKYDSNQYMPVNMTQDDIIKIYFNDYLTNMLFNQDDAYNLLNEEYKLKRFGSLEKYKEYLSDKITDSTYNMKIDRYSVNYINGKKVFNIYDESANQYIIKENSIMNYEVYLDEYTSIIE